jgi:hypothetical protein
MPATFGDVIRQVQLTCPAVPAFLIRQWALQTYAKLLSGQRWSWQKTTITYRPAAARSVALTLTPGSATVVSAALFLATDVGKQILIGGQPRLTIATFVNTSQITLDAVYGGTTTIADAQIIESFYVPPADFQQFDMVREYTSRRIMPWWLPLSLIQTWDPHFEQVGQPRTIVALTANRWIFWPINTVGAILEITYLAGPATATLTDEMALPAPLADRDYVLQNGVLVKCAMYPGTPSERNPYFNLALARDLMQQFERDRHDLGIVDDDMAPTQVIDNVDWGWVSGRRAMSDYNYQYSDASAIGYSGGGYYGY